MLKTPIMIVGAGPTGLMLSAQLHRYGAAHLIADRKPGITALSKALGVQARTLEFYHQLGIRESALAEGFIARTVRFIINGRIQATVHLGEIGTGLSPYPYLFILEQSRNEALLYDNIVDHGGEVRWSTDVVDLRKSGDGYAGTLRQSDGTTQAFECDYLIGCDGASSTVRHFTGMPFPGSTNEQDFFVADITMKTELEKQGLLLAVSGNEFLAFFPMSGKDQYRAIGILPPAVTDIENFPFSLLQSHIVKNIGFPVTITGHAWYSGYRVHHRIADSFRSAGAFLVGDAAHIHSPAGGQGMNTGLGDAVNLGWKLAAVVNRRADPNILNSYNEERRPFGVQLVHTTDRAFAMMVSRSWFPRFLRTWILPHVMATAMRFGALRRLMFRTISQTRISYRGSALSDGSGSSDLRSGDRFPWFEWDGGNSFDWFREAGYTILQLGQRHTPEIPGWDGPVSVVEVTGAPVDAAIKAGLPATGCVVVRPDMHVARIIETCPPSPPVG